MTAAKLLIIVGILGGFTATLGCTKAAEVKETSGNEQSTASTPQNIDPCAAIRDDGVTFAWGTPKDKVQKQLDEKDKESWICTYAGPQGALWLRVSLATELEDAKVGFRASTAGMRNLQRYQSESAIGDDAASSCAVMSCRGVQITFRKSKFFVEMGADGFTEQSEPVREKLRTLARRVAARL